MWGEFTQRGASEVLGAILVFAILVSSLAVFQTSVVPNQNEQVEFNGYDQARADLVELNTQVVRTAGQGTQGSATVKTGVTYPARAFALNPGSPSGSITLTPLASASIRNAESVDDDAADYWDGSARDFGTQRVVFRPAYNRLDADPVTATGSLVYRLPEDGSAILTTEQTLVRGTRISLTAVRGDLSTAGQRVTLSTLPVSTATETVRVTGADTDDDGTAEEDVVLEIPTDLSQSTWDRALAGQIGSGPNQHVEGVNVSGGLATITLDGNETYSLQLAKVEVREQSDDPVIDDANPAYVVAERNELSGTVEKNTTLEVRVYDTFGNPDPGEAVTFFEESANGSLSEITVRTDDRGLARVQYQAPEDPERASIRARCDQCRPAGGPNASNVTLTVEVSAGPDQVDLPPTVEITDIVQTGDDPDTFKITISATDPRGNLSSARFKLKNANDADREGKNIITIDEENKALDGDSDNATVTLDPTNSNTTDDDNLTEYHIVVIVTDQNEATDTVSVVTSGNESGVTPNLSLTPG